VKVEFTYIYVHAIGSASQYDKNRGNPAFPSREYEVILGTSSITAYLLEL
jgi:hypothetical protein